MIAVVLLVAFTIAVGGIISVWLTGYTRTTTETVGGTTEKQIKCASSILRIKDVVNSTTANTTILIYYESGTEKLKTLGCEAIGNATVATSTTLSPSEPSAGFSAGDSITCNINATSAAGIDVLDRVRTKATCQDEIPVSADCKPDQACW